MTDVALMGLLVLASVFIFVVAPVLMARRTESLRQAEKELDAAYQAAQRLMKSDTDGIGEKIVHTILFFASHAARPDLARRMALDILNGSFFEKPDPQDPRLRELRRELAALSEDQRNDFAAFIGHTLMSSASSSAVLAQQLRQLIVFGLTDANPKRFERREKVQAVALDLLPRSEKDCELAAA